MAEESDDVILNVEIDVRSKFSPFNYPKLPEVILAIEEGFRQDVTKVVKALRGPLMGLYKIEAADYGIYIGKSITIRGKAVPISVRRKQEKRPKDGILVTIYDAFSRNAQEIPGTLFDEHFMQQTGLTMRRQTHPQFYKGTRVLNGNRFFVADFDPNVIDIGELVTIGGSSFNLRYDGMQKFCYLCQKRHGNRCEARERFAQMKAEREGKLTHKIYTDSTLRNVNQLALSANVACTSGGGIGQIANAIHEDPEVIADIIVFGGANEIKQIDDQHEFMYTITKAAEKLHTLSSSKKVTLLLPTTPRETADEEAKYQLLKETMGNLRSITVIELPANDIEYAADRHPTQSGTKAIIGLMEQKLEARLVLQPDDVTTDRRYSQVQACYKVGCRACGSRDYTSTLCAQCLLDCKDADITRLQELIKEITERDFPTHDENVEMGDINKRGKAHDADDDNDTDNKRSKVSTNGV